MSSVPDSIRSPYCKPRFQNTKGSTQETRPNFYYEGNLSESDASYLAGFDWAVEMGVKNFFENIDTYFDELEECGIDDIRLSKLNKAISDYFETKKAGKDFDLDQLTDSQVRLAITLLDSMLHWLEIQRDELGVTMIENTDDETLAENVDKCKAGYKNIVLRQNENVFHFNTQAEQQEEN